MAFYGILTAANPKNDLDFLKTEFQNLHKYFDPQADVVRTIINFNATEEAVSSTFLGNLDIRLFHFSGHAGDASILMDDGRLSNLNIITNMIRDAKSLKLVFLNGCATEELIHKFLDKGASLVIATQAPVFDRVACDFSSYFYEALCNLGLSIGKAFVYAQEKIQEGIKARVNEIAQQAAAEKIYTDYSRMLEALYGEQKTRTIGKEYKIARDPFKWAIYFKEDVTEEKKQIALNWTLREVLKGNQLETTRHAEPTFDFVKAMAEAAISVINDLSPNNPRLESFRKIEEKNNQANSWYDEATQELIPEIGKILLLPLNEPYNDLVNFSNAKTSSLDVQNAADLKGLLQYQVSLYTAFVRTAAAIMISDFTEALIRVNVKENNIDFKKHFSTSICSNPSLKQSLQELIQGNQSLDDIPFTINLMRSIVFCLGNASEGVSDEIKELFEQFIKEYNGNSSGTPTEIAYINSLHEVLIEIKKKLEDGSVDQANEKTLRAYCDRTETALIELFQFHKYVLMYEMVTVIKAEAIRQRIKPSRTINHELITTLGLFTPSEIKYGDEFVENLSVVLISDRINYVKYLSLSPFIINVSPFLEDEKSKLFYFIKKPGEYVEYIELNEKEDPNLHIHIKRPIQDPAFLKLNNTIGLIYQKRGQRQRDKAKLQFAKVRELYMYWETKTLELINRSWEKQSGN